MRLCRRKCMNANEGYELNKNGTAKWADLTNI